ncbi:MAG TPA: DUF86 domain-containing protein [Caldisericia bacterium]|nr:DUF86 domain-containing protein [Caldisericia bacterium]HRT36740.1 DUF86 domain-containing protein [Caldisericia bacterium]HRU73512.1 DUF86 domain-containing protein [Caldisericia bacterium]
MCHRNPKLFANELYDKIYLMINKELLIKKIEEIKNLLALLEEYKNISLNEFLKNREKIDATKYRLINIIEACINICNHIIVKEYNIIPESYSDCFEILNKKGILKDSLTKNLIKMTKFRNLLIHLYSKVDDEEIYNILKDNLNDINDYINEISKLI